jgi:phosphoglucomutase
LLTVAQQLEPDGNFPTVSYANPEDPSALDLLVNQMRKDKIRYGIATDPDADRLAVVEMVDGTPYFFTGNQMGALFCFEYLKARAPIPANSFVVRTVVTSSLIDQICRFFNVNVKTCLTGFKNIARVMEWNISCHQSKFLFGTEESIGYLFGDQVRDKDGVQASLMAFCLIQGLAERGESLFSCLTEIYNKFGFHYESLKNINLQDHNLDQESMNVRMEKVRENYPENIGGFIVQTILDYEKGARFTPGNIRNFEQIETQRTDLITFMLAGNLSVSIRPSGTEPKVKIYTMGRGCKDESTTKVIEKVHLVERAMADYFLS